MNKIRTAREVKKVMKYGVSRHMAKEIMDSNLQNKFIFLHKCLDM